MSRDENWAYMWKFLPLLALIGGKAYVAPEFPSLSKRNQNGLTGSHIIGQKEIRGRF